MAGTATRVTFDVSHRVRAGGSHVKGFLRHVARDVDMRNGVVREHANATIDPRRTLNNVTLVPSESGGWERASSVEAIEQRLDDRLATVTGRTRSDSVVMRGIVLGVSPEWIAEHAPGWRDDPAQRKVVDKALTALASKAATFYGRENVVCLSKHYDEAAPQIQMAMTPVTDDHRLNQKDFFKGPKHLAAQHRELRKHLASKGYDVEMTSSPRSTEHKDNATYIRERESALAERERQLAAAEQDAQRAAQEAVQERLAAAEEEAARLVAQGRQRAAQVQQEAAEVLRQEADRLDALAAEQWPPAVAMQKAFDMVLQATPDRHSLPAVRAAVETAREKMKTPAVRQHTVSPKARAAATRRAVDLLLQVEAEQHDRDAGE